MASDLLQACKALLSEQSVNPASTIEFEVNGELHTLSLQQIIESYMQASAEAQLVFFSAMQKSVESGNMGIQKFFEGMGRMLLMAAYSEHFDPVEK